MCSGSKPGSYLSLIDFVSLNSRLGSNKEEEEEIAQNLCENPPSADPGVADRASHFTREGS